MGDSFLANSPPPLIVTFQNLNQELQDTVEEREQLKQQVQDYIIEVKRIEELLAAKEQERSDLLEQYR